MGLKFILLQEPPTKVGGVSWFLSTLENPLLLPA